MMEPEKQGRLFDDDAFKPPSPPKKETRYNLKKQEIPFLVSVRVPIAPDRIIIRLSGTGHRPDKLGGYYKLEQSEGIVVPELVRYLQALHAEFATDPEDKILVISGMAQGWDTWLALAALDSGVCHLIAAVPCLGQESPWPAKAQAKYNDILARAHETHIVCESYDYDAMQLRNEYMVDNSDTILAMWNGTSGGTKNCLDYVPSDKTVINFWSELAPLLRLPA